MACPFNGYGYPSLMTRTSPGLATGFNLSVITDKAAQIFVIFVIYKFNFVGTKGADTRAATIPALSPIHIHHIIIGWPPATPPVPLPTPTTTIIITHVLSPVIAVVFTLNGFRWTIAAALDTIRQNQKSSS